MALSIEEFVLHLRKSQVFSEEEIEGLLELVCRHAQVSNGDELAHALVRLGRLTQYQAAALHQGKPHKLLFDEYVILEKLGQGGMGAVFKASHRRMKRLVAVKVMATSALGSWSLVRRFYREVETVGKLDHPNIVAAYDAREFNGVHYLVMEYVDGRDLATLVRANGCLPLRQAVDCVIQAAHGLGYAHAQGVIHRDIKPSNLLLDKRGNIKILDLGLARVVESCLPPTNSKGERLTHSGQTVGTWDYMAPEQALNPREADHRADIYSLGCTLYQLLTGKLVYKADSIGKVLLVHQNEPIPPLAEARPDVPQKLDAIYQKMVAKDPDHRFQSMAKVLAALEPLFDSLPDSPSGLFATNVESEPTDSPTVIRSANAESAQEDREKIEEILGPISRAAVRPARNMAARDRFWLFWGIGAGAVTLITIAAVGYFARIASDKEQPKAEQPKAEKSKPEKPKPQAAKQPNAWNLYDMCGNFRQPGEGWFDADDYKNSPLVDPTGPATGTQHALRDGFRVICEIK